MGSKIKPEVTEKSFKENINSIVKKPHNAIIELIANAHDAGATELHIKWDDNRLNDPNSSVEFKDNGCGMSNDEFKNIWPQLSYNRFENSDDDSIEVITDSGDTIPRKIYGKNGKGRHSPFAFSNKYIVKTVKDNECSVFEISEDSETGFSISDTESKSSEEDNGTSISFKITKIDNNLSIDDIKETIASRFLKDPNFNIYLNTELINLGDIPEDNKNKADFTYKGHNIKIIRIKSNNKSNFMRFHGISWKFGNRFFSEDWNHVLDGRLKIAKKYSFIICADFLEEYLNETMTGFDEDNLEVKNAKNAVYKYIKDSLNELFQKERMDDKKEIIESNYSSIKNLGVADKIEVVEFINEVQKNCSSIKKEDLRATTEIFIKLKESSKGYDLLHKLSSLSTEELDELDEILKEWDVRDARCVLDLISDRLNFINALEKKMNDPNTDELHELQVLFEKGLWIFGPEYESIHFTSNKSLSTVVKEIFKDDVVKVNNPRLRPDFVVLPDASIGLYSSFDFDDEGEVDDISKLLIVELKRGGFKITSKERNQTSEYIEQLLDGGHISESTRVDAYVLGSTVNTRPTKLGDNDQIRIKPLQYHILLKRAEKRLFGLRDKIKSVKNISDKTGDEVMDEIMSQEMLDC